ncbi:MAG: hypothetical protein NC390_05430 [Fusobacterium sp.]|nr:hypothetical protein [Fusobacterium sp.]
MRVDSVNRNNIPPTFGHIIKTRFFEVLPDSSKVQIQDMDEVKTVCKRLCYHLSQPQKTKKNRLDVIPQFLSKYDNDYAATPLVRRMFNFNRAYDRCVYLFTGKDAVSIAEKARVDNHSAKKRQIIEHQWGLVRDSKRRLQDSNSEELALNIFLRPKVDEKTGEKVYFFKQMQLIQERLMHFPHRLRGANLE